ncbi:MAG: hypothetical protein ABJH45_14280 [Paracoccaceae bacterium]
MMMKLLRGIALVALVFSLYLATPYLRQKLFVTDESAAAALNQLEDNEQGPQIIACINLETTIDRMWNDHNAVELTAHNNSRGPWGDTQIVISGLLGWHVTWIAAIPRQTKPVVVYDMIDVGGGSMWSRKVPPKVINALARCGVEYMGVWKGEPPPGF